MQASQGLQRKMQANHDFAGARAIFRHATLGCAGILAGTLMNSVTKQDLASPPAMQGSRILNSYCIEFRLAAKGYVPVPRWQP